MRDYFDSVFKNNQEVRVLVVATDGSAWLPASQRDAAAVAKDGLEISLLHRDGREVAVTAAGIAGVSPDAQGKNLEAIFFSPTAGTTGDALAEKLSACEEQVIMLQGLVQGLGDRLTDTKNECLDLHKRVEDLEAQFQTGRIPALENALAKIKAPKVVEPPVVEPHKDGQTTQPK